MFANLYLKEHDVSSFNTKNVKNMTGMFFYNICVTTIYASDNFVVNNATESKDMFAGCRALR